MSTVNRSHHYRPANIITIMVLGLAMLASAAANRALAEYPTGVWLDEDRDAKIQLVKCGDALCGHVVWIQQVNDPANGQPWVDKNNADPNKRGRSLLGLTIVKDMKPSSTPNKWSGQVYSIVFGKNFNGSLTLLSPTSLKIEGCVLLICQSEIWTKAN
jgi:uncharacterized protein (DUF2147 family)